MYNISALNNINNYKLGLYKSNSVAQQNTISNINTTDAIKNTNNTPKFSPNFGVSPIRTSLISKSEHKKYEELSKVLDKKARKDLQIILKNGKLLNCNSNDGSTTLDNLHKIITNKGLVGLDRIKVATDVIERITNPPIITQKFGDIPAHMIQEIIENEAKAGKHITPMDLDVKSSTCPAASIEFNLADKMPAEFARMAEGLTSENISVTKKIKVNELSQGLIDTIWMLNEFGTKHKLEDWNTLTVQLEPDRNAIIRARIQNSYKDKDERASIDVLMQSTFMNIGAQITYNTLIDKRTPKYNDDDSGLIDIEKNFAEELATGKGKVCVTYQKIDDNGRLIGYECEQDETLTHIQNTLKQGDNVIIGYTYCDEYNNVIGGHEITIVGIDTDKKGEKYFICNDTDDGITNLIKYPVSELLPKIHHAGIPKSVLVNNVEFVDGWKELMKIYKDTKTQQQIQNATLYPPYQYNAA